MIGRRRLIIYVVLCLGLLGACRADTLDDVKDRGVLYVGMDPSYVPFEALAPGGELYGYDVDLARELAMQLGVDVNFVFIGYDGLYSALNIEQVDVLISALVIEQGRTKDVAYSDSYFNAGLVLVTREDQAGTIQKMADLEGKTLSVEVAAAGDATARSWSRRLNNLTVLPLPTAEEALGAVLAVSSDAALVDAIGALLFMRENSGLSLSKEPITVEPYAIVVRAEDKDLLRAIDNALGNMNSDGTMDSINRRWFWVDPDDDL